MRAAFGAVVVAALAWAALPAGADAPRTLGEAAAKEKDKKKPAKVYTEDDLHNRKGGSGSYSQPAAEGTSTDASATGQKKAEGDKTAAKPGEKPADKPKTEDELRAEAEKGWQDRVAQAQKDVGTWSAEVDRLQASLNDNRPAYAPGRAQALEALENAKKQLAAAQQTLAGLQEEGRRNRYR